METTATNSIVHEDPDVRMRRPQSERRAKGGDVMKNVLAAYFTTPRDKLLEAELDNLIESFRLAQDAAKGNAARRVGRLWEGRALTVVGESGAGKSRSLDRLFFKRAEFAGYGNQNADCMLISVTAPSPCTLRLLGMSVLAALGYETPRELKENVVWDLVHHQLELRGVCFLHIDELQHVHQSRNQLEITKVQDTLKGLMQHRQWPVWLVLSGHPDIATMLSRDEQVWRRTRHVVFEDLTLERDAGLARRLISVYGAEKASLAVGGLADDEFVARLLHAAIFRFGIVIELIQDAIWHALLHDADTLGVEHFAAALASRTGCPPDRNIFLVAQDWHLIDPRDALHRKDPTDIDVKAAKTKEHKAPRDVRNK